jgi:hypothetical protein
LRVRLAAGAAFFAAAPIGASAQEILAEANRCAIYGAGYVALMSGEGCARIGERMRVEVEGGPRAVASPPPGALGYAPVATGSVSAGARIGASGTAQRRAPADPFAGPPGSREDLPRTR